MIVVIKERLPAQAAATTPGASDVYRGRETTRKARITSRPEPAYTEEARSRGITGTVVLRAVFAANGKVENIRVVVGLPSGLTERAVNAARKIKFEPAVKDGRYVSQYIQIEYNFNL
jgi:protein TonB